MVGRCIPYWNSPFFGGHVSFLGCRWISAFKIIPWRVGPLLGWKASSTTLKVGPDPFMNGVIASMIQWTPVTHVFSAIYKPQYIQIYLLFEGFFFEMFFGVCFLRSKYRTSGGGHGCLGNPHSGDFCPLRRSFRFWRIACRRWMKVWFARLRCLASGDVGGIGGIHPDE